MALTLDISTTSGLTISGAYLKVSDNLNINKNISSRIVHFNIDAFKDSDARTGGKSQIQDVGLQTNYSFIYDITSTDNIIVQAYTYLKSLNTFKNALDC